MALPLALAFGVAAGASGAAGMVTAIIAGIHGNARTLMERGGLVKAIGQENFFWSSDHAIIEA